MILYINQPILQLYILLSQSHSEADEESKTGPDARTQPILYLDTYAGDFTRCVLAFHRVFGAFLKLSIEDIRAVPVFQLVRITHALFVSAIIQTRLEFLGSKTLRNILIESLATQSYVDRVIPLLRESLKIRGRRCPVEVFLALLTALQGWMHQKASKASSLNIPAPPGELNSVLRQSDTEGLLTGQTPLDLLTQVATDNPDNDQQRKSSGSPQDPNKSKANDSPRIEDSRGHNDYGQQIPPSTLGTALKLVLAEGSIDLAYLDGFLEMVRMA